MHSRNSYGQAKEEHLSPWGSANGWSFNPRALSVASPTQRPANSDYPSRGEPRRTQTVSVTQLATLGLLMISLGLIAAIASLLIG